RLLHRDRFLHLPALERAAIGHRDLVGPLPVRVLRRCVADRGRAGAVLAHDGVRAERVGFLPDDRAQRVRDVPRLARSAPIRVAQASARTCAPSRASSAARMSHACPTKIGVSRSVYRLASVSRSVSIRCMKSAGSSHSNAVMNSWSSIPNEYGVWLWSEDNSAPMRKG